MAIVMEEETASPDAEIGERVHQLIWRRRLQQASIAQRMGISASTFSRKLRGARPWTTGELISVAAELGVTVGYLFGETGPEVPGPQSED